MYLFILNRINAPCSFYCEVSALSDFRGVKFSIFLPMRLANGTRAVNESGGETESLGSRTPWQNSHNAGVMLSTLNVLR